MNSNNCSISYNQKRSSSSLPSLQSFTFTRNIPVSKDYDKLLNRTSDDDYLNNPLNCLFNKIQLKLDKLTSLQQQPQLSNKREQDRNEFLFLDNSTLLDKDKSFVIDLSNYNHINICIKLSKSNKYILIENHLGNLNNLISYCIQKTQTNDLNVESNKVKRLCKTSINHTHYAQSKSSRLSSIDTLINYKTEHKSTIELLINFRNLIEICFKLVGSKQHNNDALSDLLNRNNHLNNKLYKIVKSSSTKNDQLKVYIKSYFFFTTTHMDNDEIKHKKKRILYTIDEILAKLFQHLIVKTIWKVNSNLDKILLVIPNDYLIFEKTQLKKFIENCVQNKEKSVEVLKIITKSQAKVLSLYLNEKRYVSTGSSIVSNNLIVSQLSNRTILIDFDLNSLYVCLYETYLFKPCIIKSSLIDFNFNSQKFEKSLIRFLYEKLRTQLKLCVNDFKIAETKEDFHEKYDLLKDYLLKLNEILNKDENINVIELSISSLLIDKFIPQQNLSKNSKKNKKSSMIVENVILRVYKYEIIQIFQEYLDKSINLINVILNEQNITCKNDIKSIHISCIYFKTLVLNLFRLKFNTKLVDSRQIHVNSIDDRQLLIEMTKLIRKMCITHKDYLEYTLNCSIGTGDYNGIFYKQLKRGLTLPCSCVTTTTTIYDNQSSLLIEIYQGERPLTRYCNLIGKLLINDLPLDKAEKIIIEIEFQIDKNEILTIKAHELKTNKKLMTTIDYVNHSNGHNLNNINNLVIEYIENKGNDDRLVSRLESIDRLIEQVRLKDKCLTNDKINNIIDDISRNEYNLSINDCDLIIEKLNSFLLIQ